MPPAIPQTAAPGSPTAAAGRLLRATRAMQLRDWRAAMSLLSAETEKAPQGWLAFDLRALCCLQMGRHQQALEDAMRCTQLNPEWWVLALSGWRFPATRTKRQQREQQHAAWSWVGTIAAMPLMHAGACPTPAATILSSTCLHACCPALPPLHAGHAAGRGWERRSCAWAMTGRPSRHTSGAWRWTQTVLRCSAARSWRRRARQQAATAGGWRATGRTMWSEVVEGCR